jgi:tripartite-type tricarboxylate transporter receptor subunit TctC
MKHFARTLSIFVAAACITVPLAGLAQTYPVKPIRMFVPLPPGGAVDVVARTVTNVVTEKTRMQFLQDNRPGANTIVSTDACAKAQPDGYTICLITSSLSLNQFLYTKLPFDYIKDLDPITNLVYPYEALVMNSSLPAKNLMELIAYAKANPRKLNFGSLGIGGAPHLVPEWINRQTGAGLIHIPYKGTTELYPALLNGDIHLIFFSLGNPGLLGDIKSGKVKVLFVEAPKRIALLPDVPTMAESGVLDHEFRSWWGMAAPAGTPRDVIRKLNVEFAEAVRSPAVRDRFAPLAIEPIGNTVEEFTKYLLEDRVRGERLVKASGARLE